jgi:hypothetical protein
MPRLLTHAAGLSLVLLLAGCSGQTPPAANIEGGRDAGSSAASGEVFPYVIVAEVEYYNSGPQQGRPPDGKLPAGTNVNVLRRTGGYSLVRSPDGVEAYIASDAIQEPGLQTLP